MATVNALLARLTADSSELVKGFKNADTQARVLSERIEKTLGNLDKNIENVGKNGFTRFQASIVTLNQSLEVGKKVVHSAIAAYDALIGKSVANGEALNDMSQKVGASVETLSSLQLSAEQSGLSLDDLGTTFKFLNKSMVEATNKNSDAASAFRALGIDVLDADKKLKSNTQVMLELSDAFNKAEDSAGKTAVAQALLSKTGTNAIPFLNQGSKAIRAQAEEAEHLGLVLSTQTAASADQFGDTIQAVQRSVLGISNDIARALLPALNDAASAMLTWVKNNREWIAQNITDFFARSVVVARQLGPIIFTVAQQIATLVSAYAAMPAVVQQIGLVGVLLGGTSGLAVAAILFTLGKLNEFINLSKEAGNPFAKWIPTWESNAEGSSNFAKALAALHLKIAGVVETQWTLAGQLTDVLPKGMALLSSGVNKATGHVIQWSKATEEVKSKQDKFNDNVAEQVKILQLQIPILAHAVANTLDYGDTMQQVEIIANKVRGATDALAAAEATLSSKKQALIDALKEQRDVQQAILDQHAANDAASLSFRQGIGLQVAELETSLRVRKQLQAAGVKEIEIEKAVTKELARQRIQRELVGKEQQSTIDAVKEESDRLIDLQSALDSVRDASQGAFHFGDIIKDAIAGIAQGTLNLKRLAKAGGQAFITDFAATILLGKKQQLDIPFIGNLTGLVGEHGILGGILASGGQGLSSIFGDSFLGNQTQFVGGLKDIWSSALNGDWSTVFNLGPGAGLGKALYGMGTLGAGIFGGALASGIRSFAGLTNSAEAQLGGNAGGLVGGIVGSFLGPVGSFFGSFLGDFLGSLFGGLFEHIPTGGTQVRKAVTKSLKELDVVFSDQISSKRYGFEWTKKYMKETGLDFLEASKHFIPTQFPTLVANNLDKQLLAIGALMTADIADSVGKDLNQTTVTFANMIADNLMGDPAKIASFIDSWIDKAGANFEGWISKLTELYKSGRLSADLYKDATLGVINYFTKDLPEGLDISVIALRNFSEEGIFQLEAFKEEIKTLAGVSDILATILTNVFTEGFDKGLDRVDVVTKFKKMFRQAIEQALITKFVTDRLAVILAAIDFSKPIDLAAIAALHLDGEIGKAYDDLVAILKVAGYLPGEFTDAADAVDGVNSSLDSLVQSIRDINNELDALGKKKINLKIQLNQDLSGIGAITPLEESQRRIDLIKFQIPEANKKLVGRPPIGTDVLPFSQEDIQKAIDLNDELRNAILDNYNIQVDAINDVADTQIEAIHDEYDAKRKLYQASIEALNNEKQRVQELYQKRAEELQKSLQIAQSFAQLATSLQQTIDQIVIASTSIPRPEQSLFLARRADVLRNQISAASAENKAGLIQELSQNLQSQLQLNPLLQTSILKELESLRDNAVNQGSKTEIIQAQIEANTTAMNSALDRIDRRIATQQGLMESLSEKEQVAIDKIRLDAAQQIELLKGSTIVALTDLYNQQQDLVDLQIREAEGRRNRLMNELMALVGDPAKASQILNDTQGTMLLENIKTNQWLASIDSHLYALSTNITPAAAGLHTDANSHHLLLTHPNERIDITPAGSQRLESGAYVGGGVAMTQTNYVTMPSSGNMFTDVKELAVFIDDKLKDTYRNGWMAKELQRRYGK